MGVEHRAALSKGLSVWKTQEERPRRSVPMALATVAIGVVFPSLNRPATIIAVGFLAIASATSRRSRSVLTPLYCAFVLVAALSAIITGVYGPRRAVTELVMVFAITALPNVVWESDELRSIGKAAVFGWSTVLLTVIAGGRFVSIGSIANSNTLSMTLTAFLIIAVRLLEFRKIPMAFLFSLHLLALLSINARASFVAGLALAFGLLSPEAFRRRRFLMVMGWIGLAVRALSIAAGGGAAVVGGEQVGNGRRIIWVAVYRSILDRPLFGWGPGSLIGSSPSVRSSVGTYSGLSSHNLFLEVGFQLGAVGLLLLLVILFKTVRAQAQLSWNGSLAIMGCIAILFEQLFEVSLLQDFVLIGVAQVVALSLIKPSDRADQFGQI
jgi:O-antigen ligase